MGDELCHECGGSGGIDSGGVTPWGAPIDIPCPSCELNRARELQAIGASWRKDSSLEKWFPFTAQELTQLKAERDALRVCLQSCLSWLTSYPGEGALPAYDRARAILAATAQKQDKI